MLLFNRVCRYHYLLLALAAGMVFPRLAGGDVKLSLSGSFDNNVRPESWNPLVVKISGLPTNANGKILVKVQTNIGAQTYITAVHGNSSPQQVVVINYRLPDNGSVRDVTVEALIDGRKVAEETLKGSQSLSNDTPLIVALTQDQSGLGSLSQFELNYKRRSQTNQQQQQFPGGGVEHLEFSNITDNDLFAVGRPGDRMASPLFGGRETVQAPVVEEDQRSIFVRACDSFAVR